MRLLVPTLRSIDGDAELARFVDDEARGHVDGRPWLVANMVTSIDGAATLDGRSGGLGGDDDKVIFAALRAQADVILVGAQTVRDEGYHQPRAPRPDAAAARARRGQDERARLCIVTRSPTLAAGPPLLDELPVAAHSGATDPGGWQRPIVATPRANDDDRDPRLEVLVIDDGEGGVDLAALLDELGRRGLTRILCEGGPTLLAQLAAAGLVDEWNFTVAPLVASGSAVRPVHAERPWGGRLTLERLLVGDDSTMFARYLRADRDDSR